MATAIVVALSCTSTTTLHTQEVHIPVTSAVSSGGEMKAGLGHQWDTHCLHHDDQYTVYYIMVNTVYEYASFPATVMIIIGF